jgi:hypothetical protein
LAVVAAVGSVRLPVVVSPEVIAPPELLNVTCGPVVVMVWLLVAAVWVPVEVDADTVEDGGVDAEPVDAVVSLPVPVGVPVVSVLVLVVSPVELVEESPSVAQAVPGQVPTATPIPSATASAPTRPT